MSDSSIALKPVIEEPSKPMPPSKASSSSCALIEKLFSCPRMSVNQSRTKRMSRSLTKARTSSAVCGWSVMRARLQPGVGPLLERAHGRLEGLALLGEDVLHPHGRVGDHVPLDDALGLELLHPLGQQAVGEVRHQLLELREPGRAVQQHEQDRAGPALADELDSLVVRRAAGLPAYYDGPRGRHSRHRKPGRGRREGYAAWASRESSVEPSFGTSPARVTRFPKLASATWAIASSICSSSQPASRASSCRCRLGGPSDSRTAFTKRSSAASFSS